MTQPPPPPEHPADPVLFPRPLGHPADPPPLPPPTAPPPPVAPPPLTAPDDLHYRHRGSRVHLTARQRGADLTAVGRLLAQLPATVVSLALVAAVAHGLYGPAAAWTAALCWLGSGALVFVRPAERAFARVVLRLRPPTEQERALLENVWREVGARAGVDAHTYELRVQKSDEVNAVAAAGHVVGVTTFALRKLPSSHLAAVLAHELGHHTGGHAWAGLLGAWYALPARIAWWLLVLATVLAFGGLLALAEATDLGFLWVATALVGLFGAGCAVAALLIWPYLVVPLLLAPFLLAWAGRRGELRADQRAAALGFGTELAAVLTAFQREQQAARGGRKQGRLAARLADHPTLDARLAALEPYLRPS